MKKEDQFKCEQYCTALSHIKDKARKNYFCLLTFNLANKSIWFFFFYCISFFIPLQVLGPRFRFQFYNMQKTMHVDSMSSLDLQKWLCLLRHSASHADVRQSLMNCPDHIMKATFIPSFLLSQITLTWSQNHSWKLKEVIYPSFRLHIRYCLYH